MSHKLWLIAEEHVVKTIELDSRWAKDVFEPD